MNYIVGEYYMLDPSNWYPILGKFKGYTYDKKHGIFDFEIDYLGEIRKRSNAFHPNRVRELTDDERRELRLKQLLDK